MGVLTVEVAGVDRTDKVFGLDAITFSDPVNGRAQMNIVFRDFVGGFEPVEGQEVIFKEDGAARYAGVLFDPEKELIGKDSPNALARYECVVGDYSLITDKRRVWKEYKDEPLEDIVADINTNFLDGEGVTLGTVEAGPNITKTFNGQTVTEAYNELAALAADGRWWKIRAGKVLDFKLSTSEAAPGTLDNTTVKAKPRPRTWTARAKYRNRQYIRAGSDVLTILAQEEDSAEITARQTAEGGSGIYEDVEDLPDVKSGTEATAAAQAMIEKHGKIVRFVKCTTWEPGYRSGQSVTVNLSNLHSELANATYFIEQVDAKIVTKTTIEYTITAVSGDPTGGWQEHYRKRPKSTLPLRFQPSPGIIRVNPDPGVVVHRPDPEPTEFFQGPASGTLDQTPSAIGILHRTKETQVVTVRRGPVATPRQTILELWDIDENEQVATTPSQTIQWDELIANANFKTTVVVSPDSRYVGLIQYGATPRKLIIVDLWNGQKVGDVDTNISDQGNPGEPVWVGGYIYWPDQTGPGIYTYDATDPTAPTEAAVFTTTLTSVESVIPSSDGAVLYATGTGGIVALDRSNPTSLGPAATAGPVQIDVDAGAGTFTRASGDYVAEGLVAGHSIRPAGFANAGNHSPRVIASVTTSVITVVDATGMVTETGSGDETIDAVEDSKVEPTDDYASIDLDEDDVLLAGAIRADASNVRVVTVDVAGKVIALNTEKLVPLATSAMGGLGAVLSHGRLMVFSHRDPGGSANILKAQVFDVTDPTAATFVETFSYTHSSGGNIGPARTTRARGEAGRVLFTFGFNADATITYGTLQYDRIKPLELELPLLPDFGGLGLSSYQAGNLIVAIAETVLAKLAPPTGDGQVLVSDLGEPALMKWGTAGGGISSGARLTHSVGQGVANTTWTALTFDTEIFDDNTFHDGANPTRLTAPLVGRYLVGGTVEWSASSAGNGRIIGLWKNGATLIAIHKNNPPAGGKMTQTIAAYIDMAAGDYLELQVFQDSGVSLTISAASAFSPIFWMLGP